MASRAPRSHLTSRRGGSAGFTLVELMVVVILVSILAVMAVPAMQEAQKGRRTYEDAASIMMLFKNARTRAIGDQAAVTLILAFDNGATNLGVITEYESTYALNTISNGSLAAGQSTMSSCTAPSSWTLPASTTGPHPTLIEGYNMQEKIDIQSRIHLLVNSSNSGPFAFCFTPSGRMYVDSSATASTNPTFTEPTLVPSLITVVRDNGVSSTTYMGISRNVLIMPSGATRMYSKGAS